MHPIVILALGVLTLSATHAEGSSRRAANDTPARQLPTSPCPGIFRYVRNDDGSHYGEVNVAATTKSLRVQMFTTEPIRSKRKSPKLVRFGASDENEKTALFRVDFPYQDPLPKIDELAVDGKVVCSGKKGSSTFITSTFEVSQSSYTSSLGSRIGESGKNSQAYSRRYSSSTNSRL